MPFLANIGVQWAGYNVYGVLPDGSLNPTPSGIVDCDGNLDIPDDPSLGPGNVTGEVCANFADAEGFFNSNAAYTMTSPALFFTGSLANNWVGQAIPTGNQGNDFLWIQLDGSLGAVPPGVKAGFWASFDWSALGTIPDLSALVCTGGPCDPKVLVEAARCFTGIPNKMVQGIEIYLLCQWLARLNP